MKKKYIVGTNFIGYNQIKNFVGLPFENFKVIKVHDLCKIPKHIIFKIFNKSHPFFSNFYCDLGLNKVDIYHFFNAIALTKKNWVVTFETALPRYNYHSEFGLKILASENCKKIIAISDRAIAIQRFFLKKFPKYEEKILEKIIRLPPSQELHVTSINYKSYDEELVFTMVGAEFFRKGGLEILNAFEELINEGYPVKLNIISRLEIDADDNPHIAKDGREESLLKINKYSKSIKYYRALPNDKIIEVFKQSHIGLLPSHHETYGYSTLESMACGCPVIVTNIPPLCEFIKEKFGWLIDVPQIARNGTYVSDIGSFEKSEDFSRKLTDGIYTTIKKICAEPNVVKDKAIAAIENIRINHNPINAANILEGIYNRIL